MKDNAKLLIVGIASCLAIIATLILAAVLIPKYYPPPSGSGEFGDMFGVVNALFSGFAFLGVIIAILLQKKELTLQREELEQTRGELAGQREQLSLQSATLRKQAFDNTFFQMLNLHHSIVDGIDAQIRNGKETGRDVFKTYYKGMDRHYETTELAKIVDTDERWDAAYERLYGYIQNDVGHYFRNLFQIIEFVHQSDAKDKRFYSSLVRAQLSSHELLLLFYNARNKHGREKFKPLIEQYALLKNMPVNELKDEAHIKWFDSSAFRPRDDG